MGISNHDISSFKDSQNIIHNIKLDSNAMMQIAKINQTTEIKNFNCGDDEPCNKLNEFLYSYDFTSNSPFRIYAAVVENKIIGYYSINADAEEIGHNRHPSIYISALAVHKEWQKRPIPATPIGYYLFLHCAEICLEISQILGVSILTITAVNFKVAQHYKKWGFQYLLDSTEMAKHSDSNIPMYIGLETLGEILKLSKTK